MKNISRGSFSFSILLWASYIAFCTGYSPPANTNGGAAISPIENNGLTFGSPALSGNVDYKPSRSSSSKTATTITTNNEPYWWQLVKSPFGVSEGKEEKLVASIPNNETYWWQLVKSPFGVSEGNEEDLVAGIPSLPVKGTTNAPVKVIVTCQKEQHVAAPKNKGSACSTPEAGKFQSIEEIQGGLVSTSSAAASATVPVAPIVVPSIIPPSPASFNETGNITLFEVDFARVHAACSAALKCVPASYCTLDGTISDKPVYKDAYSSKAVPLTDCVDSSGGLGKCCRDPLYDDPWPKQAIDHSGQYDHDLYNQDYSQPATAPVAQSPPKESVAKQQPASSYYAKPSQYQAPIAPVAPSAPTAKQSPAAVPYQPYYYQQSPQPYQSYQQTSQPYYQQPSQPYYQQPSQPSYQQPSYQQPSQPSYQQPSQPSYQQPYQYQPYQQQSYQSYQPYQQPQVSISSYKQSPPSSQQKAYVAAPIQKLSYSYPKPQLQKVSPISSPQYASPAAKYIPPAPVSAYTPPAAAPTYIPPAAAPTYIPPPPAQKYIPPAPASTYIPPAPASTYIPPAPASTYIPPAPPSTTSPAVEYIPPSQSTPPEVATVSTESTVISEEGKGVVSEGETVPALTPSQETPVSESGPTSEEGKGIEGGIEATSSAPVPPVAVPKASEGTTSVTVTQTEGEEHQPPSENSQPLQPSDQPPVEGASEQQQQQQQSDINNQVVLVPSVPSSSSVETAESAKQETITQCGVKIVDAGVQQDIPWHATVYSAGNKTPLCDGVIVSENAVLTAAHCLDNVDSEKAEVKVGSNALNNVQNIKVAVVTRHPAYDVHTFSKDMAVVILKEPITFTNYIQKICLPEESGVARSTYTDECVVTASTDEGDLQKIKIQQFPYNDCVNRLRSTYLGKYFTLKDTFSCASSLTDDDLCKARTGSPISCDRGDGHYVISGLKSWDLGCKEYKKVSIFSKSDLSFVKNALSEPFARLASSEQSFLKNKVKGETLEDVNIEQKPGFALGYGK